MKTKQLSKKLKLNKKTVAHLDNGEMKVEKISNIFILTA